MHQHSIPDPWKLVLYSTCSRSMAACDSPCRLLRNPAASTILPFPNTMQAVLPLQPYCKQPMSHEWQQMRLAVFACLWGQKHNQYRTLMLMQSFVT